MDTDYFLERRLSILDLNLHRRYKDCVVTSQAILARYQSTFPEYTDHTILHTMNVINFCNKLIGNQVECLTADDIYVLLMGCLFHDVGMGISLEDYEQFKLGLIDPTALPAPEETIRKFHHEFSAMYLAKYSEILDIPNEAYLYAIMQICTGHRKTNLMNKEKYPATYQVAEGRSVCISYLAAILCLADELDIAVDRNIDVLYDINKIEGVIDILEHSKHQAIRSVELGEHTITLRIKCDDPAILNEIMDLCKKTENTLHSCRKVVEANTKFVITQQDLRVIIDK